MSTAAARNEVRALVDRVRALLPGRELREVRMFGTIAVMVDGAMAVAAGKDGSLLVRVDPAEDEQLLEDPHASRPAMGGRSMGVGWIRVDEEGLRTESSLGEWVGRATRYLSARG